MKTPETYNQPLSEYLPLALKVILSAWPLIGFVSFGSIFFCYFLIKQGWLKVNNVAYFQIKAIYKLCLTILLIALVCSLIFFSAIQSQLILKLVSFSVITLYVYMLFKLFFRIKVEHFEQP